jgi:hypothetical protein
VHAQIDAIEKRTREVRVKRSTASGRQVHCSAGSPTCPQGIGADSTCQRAVEIVVEDTVPEVRGRWAERELRRQWTPRPVGRLSS